MGVELAFLRKYFKVFYMMTSVFVLLTVAFFALLYLNRLKGFEKEVYNVQGEVLSIFSTDYEVSRASSSFNESRFFDKYNSANLVYIDSVLVVKQNGEAFFTGNPEKKYRYIGQSDGGRLNLDGVHLEDKLISERTMSDGLSVYVVTAKSFARDAAYDMWIAEQRLHFSISILVPLIIMMIIYLIEDKIVKELEGRFNSAFELAKSHEVARDELYSGLFFQNRSIILLIDPTTGDVVKGNESAKNYYGYNFAEEKVHITQINMTPKELIYGLMSEAISKNKNYFNFQHRLKNGMVRDVEVYSGPVVMDGRELLCSVVHDVTDKIRAEQTLIAQQEKMAKSLAAKSGIIATISHEIKTPISGILQNIQEIAQDISDPVVLNQVEFLRYNVENLNRLVFDLLDYTRLDAGGLKLYSVPFDLVACLTSSVKLFRPVAKEKRIRISLETDNLHRSHYIGDQFRISQVINNLLSNSLKYTNDGTVTLRASSEAMDYQSLVTIEVIDTGVGMDDETIGQIFSPYFTSDTTGELRGTGMGLAICRMIVEAMDGTLEVHSELGAGSHFVLTLDLDNDDHADARLLESSESVTPSAERLGMPQYKVLLVDDDPLNLFYLEKLLRNISGVAIDVETAYNGIEAIENLKQTRFTHVLSDYQLPDTNGLKLFSEIQGSTGSNPKPLCLLMSADQVITQGQADAFLLKPISLEHLKPFFAGLAHKRLSEDRLRDHMSQHQYLGFEEWRYLTEQVGFEDLKAVLGIFGKSLDDRIKQMPKGYETVDDERIHRIIHAIKGSISYFKSERFLKELISTEQTLRDEAKSLAEKQWAYSHFVSELTLFAKEAQRFIQWFDEYES